LHGIARHVHPLTEPVVSLTPALASHRPYYVAAVVAHQLPAYAYIMPSQEFSTAAEFLEYLPEFPQLGSERIRAALVCAAERERGLRAWPAA